MGPEKLSAAEKREALSLVLESQTFSRSDRLKSLLRFVCEAEIEGRADRLNEYAIATEALGRPADFSPGEDSSVRSRAYELRRKLEKFYAAEAPDASLRIDIPKGSYLPRFVVAPAGEPPLAVPAVRRRPLWPLAAAFVAGLVLMAGGLAAWIGLSSRPRVWTPELEAIWKPMLDSKAPILVSFQTRLFFIAGPLAVRDWKVDTVGAVESSESLMRVKQFFNAPQLYENHNYIDFGAANAVFQLSKLLGTRKQNLFAKRSCDVTWDDFKTNNVIIIGKPEADATVSRWLAKGKFIETGGRIRNLNPAPGELEEWVDRGARSPQTWAEKYALISMFPGPGAGNWVMSLAGSGSEHPWAMADYLTNPQNARDFIRRLRLPSGQLPAAYQVVVRAEFKAQEPVKVAYVAHRPLETP
jgi:hypothetical protein